jgi:hypothetical protein
MMDDTSLADAGLEFPYVEFDRTQWGNNNCSSCHSSFSCLSLIAWLDMSLVEERNNRGDAVFAAPHRCSKETSVIPSKI